MLVRRLQETVDGTFFVPLPKSWIARNSLRRGNLVSFTERDDGKIVIGLFEGEKTIRSATFKPSSFVGREIIEKYLLGYDLVEVASDEVLDSRVRDQVKEALKRLVGMEIIEEDAKRLVVQCLLEPKLLTPTKILRRLHLFTLSMEEDAVSSVVNGDLALARTVSARDDEVDRLYFLLVRLLRTAIAQPSVSEKLGLSAIDCMDYRLLASLMETLGDCAVRIGDCSIELQGRKFPEQFGRAVQQVGRLIYTMYHDAVNAVLCRDLAQASEVRRLYEEERRPLLRLEALVVNLPTDASRAGTVALSMARMFDLTVDIADLAMTR